MNDPAATLPWWASNYLLPVAVGLTTLVISTVSGLLCWFFRDILSQVKQLNGQHLAYLQEENVRNRQERAKDEDRWMGTLQEVVEALHGNAAVIKDMDYTIKAAVKVIEDQSQLTREIKEDLRRVRP